MSDYLLQGIAELEEKVKQQAATIKRLEEQLERSEQEKQQLELCLDTVVARCEELEGAIVKHCTDSCIDIQGDHNKVKWYLEVNQQD